MNSVTESVDQRIRTWEPVIRWVLTGIIALMVAAATILKNHEGRLGDAETQLKDHKESQRQSDQDTKDRLMRIEENQMRLLQLLGAHDQRWQK